MATVVEQLRVELSRHHSDLDVHLSQYLRCNGGPVHTGGATGRERYSGVVYSLGLAATVLSSRNWSGCDAVSCIGGRFSGMFAAGCCPAGEAVLCQRIVVGVPLDLLHQGVNPGGLVRAHRRDTTGSPDQVATGSRPAARGSGRTISPRSLIP